MSKHSLLSFDILQFVFTLQSYICHFTRCRDFYFKHADARSGKDKSIKRVNLVLNDGLLLLMEKPTNRFWYHALPRRKNSPGTRINLTFRKVK